jgi:hypothetical protein
VDSAAKERLVRRVVGLRPALRAEEPAPDGAAATRRIWRLRYEKALKRKTEEIGDLRL